MTCKNKPSVEEGVLVLKFVMISSQKKGCNNWQEKNFTQVEEPQLEKNEFLYNY